MFNKTILKSVGVTLAVLWAVHNVDVLKPARDLLKFDQ